ncbi:Organ specific protein [Parasponia andersonii]|uniref:Organ specific protein n=1 Tax=Parasponia andersonii TaxID=3476 RepID=A0A2P5ABL6_PARAD|nr:Organ specific protein [Parasponia andersonii]
MKYPSAFILALLSLLLFAGSIESRKVPAGEYWTNVMKDEPMPEAIQGLISSSSSPSRDSDEKTNCHESKHIHDHVFTKNFEPTPNVSAYPDDTSAETTKDNQVATNKENKPYAEDFEPRPNVSAYND